MATWTSFEGFENGDSAWNKSEGWGQDGSYSYNGSYSGGANITSTKSSFVLGKASLPNDASKIRLYFLEEQVSYGGGYELVNSNGNRIVSFGISNPSWMYADGSGNGTFYSGDGYLRWLRFIIDLDAQTIEGKDLQSGSTASYNYTQFNSGLATDIRVVNAHSSQKLADRTTNSSGYDNYVQYTDDIGYQEPFSAPSNPQNVSVSQI